MDTLKHRARPNVYVSSAELSHRLTADALTPRPPAMSSPVSWWSDLGGIDKLYLGFVGGVFLAFAVAYWWVA